MVREDASPVANTDPGRRAPRQNPWKQAIVSLGLQTLEVLAHQVRWSRAKGFGSAVDRWQQHSRKVFEVGPADGRAHFPNVPQQHEHNLRHVGMSSGKLQNRFWDESEPRRRPKEQLAHTMHQSDARHRDPLGPCVQKVHADPVGRENNRRLSLRDGPREP